MKEKERQEQQIVKVEEEQRQGIEIFGKAKYEVQIEQALVVSKIVSNIIEKQKLYTILQGKKYVTCEGWCSMGALLGLFPQIVEVKEQRDERGVKFIATCEIRTLDGKLVSKAQSECSSWERNKQKMLEQQGEYALRSTAETRAVSKAYRICLSWIMVLAGYQPTPAEEMEEEKEKEEEKKKEITIKKIKILDDGEVEVEKEEQEKKEIKKKEQEEKKEQKTKQVEEIDSEKKQLLDEIRTYYKILQNKFKRDVINAWLMFYDTSLEKLLDENTEKLKQVRDLMKEEAEKVMKGGS